MTVYYLLKMIKTFKLVVVVVVVVPQGSIRWNPAASRKFTTVTGEVHRSLSERRLQFFRCVWCAVQWRSKCSVVWSEPGHAGQ